MMRACSAVRREKSVGSVGGGAVGVFGVEEEDGGVDGGGLVRDLGVGLGGEAWKVRRWEGLDMVVGRGRDARRFGWMVGRGRERRWGDRVRWVARVVVMGGGICG